MLSIDRDALICDLAETYKIYDMRSLPLQTVATLAAGLRDDSRIKLLASGSPAKQDTILLAAIADRIEAFRYGFSKEKMPVSLVEVLFGESKEKEMQLFNSGDDFEAALRKIRGQ